MSKKNSAVIAKSDDAHTSGDEINDAHGHLAGLVHDLDYEVRFNPDGCVHVRAKLRLPATTGIIDAARQVATVLRAIADTLDWHARKKK